MDLNYLKEAKKEKKLTLQQIAEISGIPKRTVDDIFSGKTLNPRIDTLQAIERALEIDSRITVQEYTNDEQKLLSIYHSLSPEMKNILWGLLATWSPEGATDFLKKNQK